MVVFDVVVELPMDADEYLRVKDSAAYKAFHCEKNGTANEYLSDESVDGERRTVTRTIPNIAIPWALRRAILGNKRVEFIDRRRWREGSHLTAPFTQHFHTTNNISDRCVVQGTVTVEPHGPGRCVITVRGECVVEVKGLGGKIEQLIVNNLRGSYEKVPAVIAEWLAISGHHDTKPDTSFAEAPAEFTSLDLGPPTPPDDDIENGFEKDIENGFQKNHPYTNGALPRQQSYAFDRDEYRESSISMIESTFETPSTKRRRDVAEQTRVVPAPDAGVHAVHGVITRTELAVLAETGRGDTGQAQGRTGRDARCLQILPRGCNLLAMRGGVLRDRLVEFDGADDGPRARRRGARGGDREGDGGRESREGQGVRAAQGAARGGDDPRRLRT